MQCNESVVPFELNETKGSCCGSFKLNRALPSRLTFNFNETQATNTANGIRNKEATR